MTASATASSGAGGSGSSATGTRSTDDGSRSGGEMADVRPEQGRTEATPGGINAQGGTSTSAAAHPMQGPNQRHQDRQSQDGTRASNADQQNTAEVGNIPRQEDPIRPDDEDPPPLTQIDPADLHGPPRPPTPLDMHRRFPGPPRARAIGRRKKRTRASVLLAALNMRGLGNPNPWHPKHKWYHVNQVMKDNKIGILVVGEAHLSAARHANIITLFGRRLEVIFTEDPATANAKGLAFVINKDLLCTDNIQSWEIVAGRAMVIELEGRGNKKIRVLGVYAPNAPAENAAFWKQIREFFQNNPAIPKPDYMAGDMNMVEDDIDRLPCRPDPEETTTEMDLLKTYLRLVDGWRQTYPNTRAYTYTQTRNAGGGAQSRIDRIYVRRDLTGQLQSVGVIPK